MAGSTISIGGHLYTSGYETKCVVDCHVTVSTLKEPCILIHSVKMSSKVEAICVSSGDEDGDDVKR